MVKGFVYKIFNNELGILYIGSSKVSHLWKRRRAHRGSYNRWLKGKGRKCVIYPYFKEHGFDSFTFQIIETLEFGTITELKYRERHYIETMDCINSQCPIRSQAEVKEYKRERQLTYGRMYEASEKRKQRKKEYYQENKDKYFERYLKYKSRDDVVCECGSVLKHKSLRDHLTSKKHQDYIMSKN